MHEQSSQISNVYMQRGNYINLQFLNNYEEYDFSDLVDSTGQL